MTPFTSLYERALRWSYHPRAPRFPGVVRFTESSFFPNPPGVMLAPMCLANPRTAWRFALLATLASVAGGLLLFGYTIG
jgi:membrane protein YqaA with SNARE-associated domain